MIKQRICAEVMLEDHGLTVCLEPAYTEHSHQDLTHHRRLLTAEETTYTRYGVRWLRQRTRNTKRESR